MAWRIKYGDVVVLSDDFTIGELGDIEDASGVPWSVANPFRDVKVAKAFIATALSHAEWPEADVVGALESLTLKRLKNAFEYLPDEDDEGGEESADPTGSQSQSSRGSSTGASGRAGSRRKSAASA